MYYLFCSKRASRVRTKSPFGFRANWYIITFTMWVLNIKNWYCFFCFCFVFVCFFQLLGRVLVEGNGSALGSKFLMGLFTGHLCALFSEQEKGLERAHQTHMYKFVHTHSYTLARAFWVHTHAHSAYTHSHAAHIRTHACTRLFFVVYLTLLFFLSHSESAVHFTIVAAQDGTWVTHISNLIIYLIIYPIIVFSFVFCLWTILFCFMLEMFSKPILHNFFSPSSFFYNRGALLIFLLFGKTLIFIFQAI